MGKKRRKPTSTQRLLVAVEECNECACKNFPPEFLIGLRGVLDAGITCEQITAFLVLVTGWYRACEKMSGEELIQRAFALGRVIEGDIDEESYQRQWRLLRGK